MTTSLCFWIRLSAACAVDVLLARHYRQEGTPQRGRLSETNDLKRYRLSFDDHWRKRHYGDAGFGFASALGVRRLPCGPECAFNKAEF